MGETSPILRVAGLTEGDVKTLQHRALKRVRPIIIME